MVYIEEYYTVDGSGNPKYVLSNKYYDNNITYNDISFRILRPFSRSGEFYSLVKGVVIFDDKRVNERWIRTENGTHLTYNEEDEDIAKKINENIDKFEIEDKSLIANLSATYKFTTPDIAIYEVDITSTGNENYVSLRIDSLKGIPVFAKRFPGAVYQYLDISLDAHQIKEIAIRYKVENSWINNNDVSVENIKLFRWNNTDNKWYGLKTKIINKDINYTYYESEATNMSQFAIAGLRNIVTTINRTTNLTDNFNVLTKTNTITPIPSSTVTKKTEPNTTEVPIIEMVKRFYRFWLSVASKFDNMIKYIGIYEA
ncbi:PGF-pre-PGF domain-containing protein [Candidatus Methanoperedens nitratireducens]|uniref:Uncharacterized protein n=1 Tax=Candidatus Methanoperedens nitratireducens TaxID=1392998 RepID=A0A284VQF5_9EURY|nr:PGF-pre-PGF domain-containing protein [Candidatus Methanoperedens nitroreducens]SNQ61459.1 hypothetical protein MNV_370001 [Candidatus Methanoperedens nitroreducens]